MRVLNDTVSSTGVPAKSSNVTQQTDYLEIIDFPV